MKCINCGNEIDNDMLQAGVCFNCGSDISTSVEKYNDEIRIEQQRQQQEKNNRRNMKEREENYQNFQYKQEADQMLFSTTNILEGYEINGYCGIVFGEVIVKHGLIKQLSAGINDVVDIISVGDKELSGSSELFKSARKIAMEKMVEDARKRGANAIIGIDSETSMLGSGLNHVTLIGTAVKIKKKVKVY